MSSRGSCRPVLSVVSVIYDCVIVDVVSRSGLGDGEDHLSLRSDLGAETTHWSLNSVLGDAVVQMLESSPLIAFALSLSVRSLLRIRLEWNLWE